VEKALQFYQSPEVLDTYAKLLYKQNKNAKAIEMMSEAVTLQQKRGFPTKEYETSLEKMRSGKSL
jgi:Flp pilus assembly protein TadD